MGEAGRTLVGGGDGELGVHRRPFAHRRMQVEPGLDLVAAPEALTEVDAEVAARLRGFRVNGRRFDFDRRPRLRDTAHGQTLTRR